MKILYVGNAKSVHMVRWANAMAERGHEIILATCKDNAPDDGGQYASVRVVPLKYATPFGYYLNASALKKLAKKENPDIINIHYASGYGTLGRLAKLKDAVLNVWGSDVYSYPYQSGFSMKNIRKNLMYFRALSSTSNIMAEQTRSLLPTYDKKINITPFGVDMEKFKPLGDEPKDKIIFGTVKALNPVYGISDTIQAFTDLVSRLKSEGENDLAENICYEIYGQGDQKEILQKLIDDNGMTDRIKLCGYVDNTKLPEVYNRFTVFNSNSLQESFGVVAVEAMACGIPVQTSDADGFCEVVEDGVTGLLSPKGDVKAISENMYRLLMDAELRKSMSEKGVERVRLLYDWNKNVDNMLEVYNSLL